MKRQSLLPGCTWPLKKRRKRPKMLRRPCGGRAGGGRAGGGRVGGRVGDGVSATA